MEMTISEALMILSTVIALPVIAVLTIAYLNGNLDDTEDVKYTVLEDAEPDWWTDPDTVDRRWDGERWQRAGAAQAAREGGANA